MTKETFQYISDIHLEKICYIPSIKQISDNLIIAGDLGYKDSYLYHCFLFEYAKKYNRIYIIRGNHEYDISSSIRSSKLDLPNNVYLLDNQVVNHDKSITILGSTLWTRSVDPTKFTEAVRFMEHIYSSEKYLDQTIVCITHHLPSYNLISNKYKHYKNTHRFASNLEYLMNPLFIKNPPKVWICGHSHSFMRKKIFGTLCLINTFYTKASKFRV